MPVVEELVAQLQTADLLHLDETQRNWSPTISCWQLINGHGARTLCPKFSWLFQRGNERLLSRLSAVLTCAVLLCGNGSFVVWKSAVTDQKTKLFNLWVKSLMRRKLQVSQSG